MDELTSQAFIFNARQLGSRADSVFPDCKVIDCPRCVGEIGYLRLHETESFRYVDFHRRQCQKFEDGLDDRLR